MVFSQVNPSQTLPCLCGAPGSPPLEIAPRHARTHILRPPSAVRHRIACTPAARMACFKLFVQAKRRAASWMPSAVLGGGGQQQPGTTTQCGVRCRNGQGNRRSITIHRPILPSLRREFLASVFARARFCCCALRPSSSRASILRSAVSACLQRTDRPQAGRPSAMRRGPQDAIIMRCTGRVGAIKCEDEVHGMVRFVVEEGSVVQAGGLASVAGAAAAGQERPLIMETGPIRAEKAPKFPSGA